MSWSRAGPYTRGVATTAPAVAGRPGRAAREASEVGQPVLVLVPQAPADNLAAVLAEAERELASAETRLRQLLDRATTLASAA